MTDTIEQSPKIEALGKGPRTSDNFGTPLNLGKKSSKARVPLGGFYTPGNLKSHHYVNKHRDSGTHRENGRYKDILGNAEFDLANLKFNCSNGDSNLNDVFG